MSGARRAASLTQRLLAFSRRQPLDPRSIDINTLVNDMSDLLHRTLGETVEVETGRGADLWRVEADANELEAAILNLAVNARDAMPEGGRLTIETSNAYVDEDYAAQHAEVVPGQYVVVSVSDTGTGMDATTLAKAFEPFFTTKPVGRGTGLGLSQVYGFIKQSGGHVVIDSCPGVGTTFRLYLPRCERLSHTGDVQDRTSDVTPTGHETVLVVEDNAEVLELAVATISDLGYHVLTAADGPSALGIVQGDEPIDLLFSDIVMPGGMNGFELINRARVIRRGLKTLVTSGYANVHRPGADRPDVPLLLKPYRRGDLAQSIRMALDRA